MKRLIRFDNIYKTLGGTRVFQSFSLQVETGKIISIIGPSGCGKTTLLQMLAGLEQPDSGSISGVEELRVSYVFQEPRLLLWKTVAGNIDFVLRDVETAERRRELIDYYLKMMGLYEYRDHYPKTLSGGMKQRLALGRAFAFPHGLLLLDEPFKSLDTPLRLGLVGQVARMWRETRRTIVFVTHDIMEALLLGHRVLVLSAKPTFPVDTVEINVPLEERSIAREPLPGLHDRMLALLRSESVYK